MFYVSLLCFGCLSGVTAVLFGFGGGFVVVPLLYRMLTVSHGADDPIGQSAMHIAVATSTCVMIVNSLIATVKHHRAGNIVRHYVWPLGGFIGLGAMGRPMAASLQRAGIRPSEFPAGTKLTITGRPMKDGRPAAIQTARMPMSCAAVTSRRKLSPTMIAFSGRAPMPSSVTT